jgi:hypothetical protein
MDQLASRWTESRGTRVYPMSSSGRRYAEARAGAGHARAVTCPSRMCLVGWCSTRYVGSAPSRSVMWVGVTRVSTEIAETKAAVIGSGRTRV